MGFPRLAALVRGVSKRRLGDPILYRPKSGGESEILGIWSQEQVTFEAGDVQSAIRAPTVDVDQADMITSFGCLSDEGDRVIINNEILRRPREYVVDFIEEDGQGMAKLYLKLVDDQQEYA